jgi:hypothetical protein
MVPKSLVNLPGSVDFSAHIVASVVNWSKSTLRIGSCVSLLFAASPANPSAANLTAPFTEMFSAAYSML